MGAVTRPPALSAQDVPFAAACTTARHARDKEDLLDLLAALALPADEDTVTALLPQLPYRSLSQPSEETQHVNAYTAVVLSMNNDGHSDQQIADHLGIDRDEVTQIIDSAKTNPPAEPLATASPVPQPAIPVATTLTAAADLLGWAAGHDDKAIRAQGEQAAATLTVLHERRRADAELEQITAEATELEQRLADLRARESQLRPVAKTKTQRDYDPREVRSWAREQHLNVPDRGQIPKTVLAAWRQRPDARPLAVAS
ncbi:histone-like nucleoid-structuring protein Lsr2 [Streptomyces beijiangensis]|uniref:Lsr2 family DNA-binding protein n=1 Tax=Streptomyces beijiangensis TaxID=163361 RepID=UPI0031D554A6